jgi:magnesium-transporting ATPase (P-type)
MAAEGSPSSAVSGRLTKGHVKAAHFYDASTEDACRILGTDATLGLSKDAVQARRIEFGPNEMTPPKKHGLWKKVWDQLANILIVILLAAAVVAGVLKDWVELGFILGVIIINVVIGVVQESKAEKAADALKKLLSASAIVLRDGLRAAVSASDLVPGDIIFLEAGDRVPADARLIIATNLAVMEAALTGESVAAPKDAATVLPNDATLADRHNMVFAGCLVTTGQCSAVITGTGDYCEIGKINKLVANVQAGKTPLLVQIEHFGRWLSVSVIVVAVITLLVAHFAREIPVGESFKIAVAVAVAIIPEGLPSVLTIILAFGVKAMAEKHAIIRQMPAVETLGGE